MTTYAIDQCNYVKISNRLYDYSVRIVMMEDFPKWMKEINMTLVL